MSLLAVQGGATGTGTVTLLAPVTNTNRTITLPDETGTAVTTGSTAVVSQAMLATNVAGNGPAFSAYQSSAQTLSSSTATKITFTTEEFDTNSNFASSTFTPTVAGYYQVNASVAVGASYTTGRTMLYKNGAEYKRGNTVQSDGGQFIVSALVYCNGSTDYIEVYGFLVTGQALVPTAYETYFQASMVRAA